MTQTETPGRAALDQWYCLNPLEVVPQGGSQNTLLGQTLTVRRKGSDFTVAATNRALPHLAAFGHLWTTLGDPGTGLPAIPEAAEPDRTHVPCGGVTVRASGLRIVENFLDMAHFPFVHTNILGSEPHTEVFNYRCEIRRDVDEVWATDCTFVQPKAALSATDAIDIQYMYRVARPLVVMLYKTSPSAPDRWDVICLFVQPLAPDLCRAHTMMFLIDDTSAQRDLIGFQQVIFLQDRIILENQRPRLLPLEPRMETPTRADASSIAYRRWLKEKGFIYGTTQGPKGRAA
ncbi:(2Fe-2S)-binding protein [Roseicitreum antarcticum]|uniref:Phenylpropionate dioxygenase, large terminal subunit n=1 Tax=Roseicitreum antarcticum TaxID=564137 RepID=A0A1H2ZBM5_9RHOB|nr:(2Fe-2S)-binding protein [Roseicitreum antarcticum]SDX14745.1 Phenylpropionate dioxygenase, large terminal subunit [Roseicitreum antarcticum]